MNLIVKRYRFIQFLLLYNPNVDVKRALALHCRSLSEVVGMLSSHKENVKHVCWPIFSLNVFFTLFLQYCAA